MVSILRALSVLLPGLSGWVRRNPWPAAVMLLIAACAWLWLLSSDRGAQAADWHAKFTAQRAEMLKFKASVRAAQVEAARADAAEIKRQAELWAAREKDMRHDLANDLAGARAGLAEQLRAARRVGTCATGGGGAPAVPDLPDLSQGAVRSGAAAVVDVADLDICTVNTARLERLIRAWGEAVTIGAPVGN
ncbi:MAG: hypothetical protein U5M50_08675 [Sphingobium sp.]|nr:hypothetical protein [Sphingobium sp.]